MVRTTLTLLLCSLLTIASSAIGAEYNPVPTQPPQGTAPRLVAPSGPTYSLGMPSPQRPAIDPHQGHFRNHGAPVQPSTPATGWTGYGFGGVPTYQWGYFGAHYRPVKVYHRGYYGHRMSHGYRRGY